MSPLKSVDYYLPAKQTGEIGGWRIAISILCCMDSVISDGILSKLPRGCQRSFLWPTQSA
jgi:hypothetical protein